MPAELESPESGDYESGYCCLPRLSCLLPWQNRDTGTGADTPRAPRMTRLFIRGEDAGGPAGMGP